MERIFKLIVHHENDNTSAPHFSNETSIDLENFQKRLENIGVEISYDKTTQWFTLLDTSGDG